MPPSTPGQARCAGGCAQFNAVPQKAINNKALLEQGKLNFPVLAVGGEISNGSMTKVLKKLVADDVKGADVPAAGNWLTGENPEATVNDFLA